MANPVTSETDLEASPPLRDGIIANPDFSGPAAPISEWVARPDFPRCALGAFVSIHGFTGVVVEIMGASFRVVSEEGVKQRFNGDRLRSLFAPRDRTKPKAAARRAPSVKPPPAAEEVPVRNHITDPDFTAPVRPIVDYANQPDFPACAFGKHIELPDYTGVVVEIVNDSLRVQAAGGGIRRFNGAVLKKLFGKS
jgi:hypothetical protein